MYWKIPCYSHWHNYSGKNCGATVTLYGDQMILNFTNTNGNVIIFLQCFLLIIFEGSVKNVSLYKKGLDPSQIYDPDWLATISPFTGTSYSEILFCIIYYLGVYRLMTWQVGERSWNWLASWTDRALVTDSTWTRYFFLFHHKIIY